MNEHATPGKTALDTSGVDQIIGYRLRRAQAYIFLEFKNSFDQLGLSPADYSTLVLVNDNPGRKPSEIAAALGIQRANFAPLLGNLENRQLLARRKSTTDRRSFSVQLTPIGRDLLDRAIAIQTEFESKCVEQLGGEAARDTLLDLLSRFKN